MQAWVIVVLMAVAGIVGAWVGYWLGHAAGWTTDAQFPLTIGGGERAILLAIALSVASVLSVGWWFLARPLWRERRLLASGTPGHGTIVSVQRTGVFARGGGQSRHQLAFELEMHPDGGAAYRARGTRMVSEAEEATLVPGTEVDARFDPARPQTAAVVGPHGTVAR